MKPTWAKMVAVEVVNDGYILMVQLKGFSHWVECERKKEVKDAPRVLACATRRMDFHFNVMETTMGRPVLEGK